MLSAVLSIADSDVLSNRYLSINSPLNHIFIYLWIKIRSVQNSLNLFICNGIYYLFTDSEEIKIILTEEISQQTRDPVLKIRSLLAAGINWGTVQHAAGPGSDDRMRAEATDEQLPHPVDAVPSLAYAARSLLAVCRRAIARTMCENEKLIDLVRNYPILYDMKSKDYKDNVKKAEAWTDIAIKLCLESGKRF